MLFSIEMLSCCQSVCPHVSPGLPLDSFMWNLILGTAKGTAEITEIGLISGKNVRHFMKTDVQCIVDRNIKYTVYC